MSQSSEPANPTGDLQFTTAEPGNSDANSANGGVLCALCQQAIASTYFALRDKPLCPACCDRLNAPAAGSRFGRLAKATLMGFGAGSLGALIWFGIRRVAHLEIGIVAARRIHGRQSGVRRIRKPRRSRLPGVGGGHHLLLYCVQLHAGRIGSIFQLAREHQEAKAKALAELPKDDTVVEPAVDGAERDQQASGIVAEDCCHRDAVFIGVCSRSSRTVSGRYAERDWNFDDRLCLVGSMEVQRPPATAYQRPIRVEAKRVDLAIALRSKGVESLTNEQPTIKLCAMGRPIGANDASSSQLRDSSMPMNWRDWHSLLEAADRGDISAALSHWRERRACCQLEQSNIRLSLRRSLN